MHWNGFRKKYIAIIGATPGPVPDTDVTTTPLATEEPEGAEAAPPLKPSFDGEIYYAESDDLTVSNVTHRNFQTLLIIN